MKALTQKQMENILVKHIKEKVKEDILNMTHIKPDKIYVETCKKGEHKNIYQKFTIEISKGWI